MALCITDTVQVCVHMWIYLEFCLYSRLLVDSSTGRTTCMYVYILLCECLSLCVCKQIIARNKMPKACHMLALLHIGCLLFLFIGNSNSYQQYWVFMAIRESQEKFNYQLEFVWKFLAQTRCMCLYKLYHSCWLLTVGGWLELFNTAEFVHLFKFCWFMQLLLLLFVIAVFF